MPAEQADPDAPMPPGERGAADERKRDLRPERPATSAAPDGRRETQRAALRDLVALATECAATEARIEHEHVETLEHAKKTAASAELSLRQRFETQRQGVRDKFQQAVAQVTAQFKRQLTVLQGADEPARQKIELEHDAVGHNVTKRLEHAAWMADSALEISLNQLREQEKQLDDQTAEYAQALNEMRDAARARAARYGYTAEAPRLKTPAPAEDQQSTDGDDDREEGHGYVDLDAEMARDKAATAEPEEHDDPSLTPEQAEATFAAKREQATAQAETLHGLALPRLVVGSTPYLAAGLLVACVAGVVWLVTGLSEPNFLAIGITAGAMAVVCAIGILFLRSIVRRQAREALEALEQTLLDARQAGKAQVRAAARVREQEAQRARHKRDAEVRASNNHFAPASVNAQKKREKGIAALDATFAESRATLEAERDVALAEARDAQEHALDEMQQREQRDAILGREQAERHIRVAHERYQQAKQALERRLVEGLASIRAPIGPDGSAGKPLAWNDPAWDRWTPSKAFAAEARFGELEVDLQKIANSVPRRVDPNAPRPIGPDGELIAPEPEQEDPGATEQTRLALPPPFAMPATLAFPRHASLLVQADREGRPAAIRTLQMVMSRLLTTLPPGRVRFTLIDPVGLGQNFAGFMHLADHDEALVGGRIWTEQDHIEQRLTHLTGHMETVIQKYLRNEFETIDEFNAQAGELAEPYRFLVICDFPSAFTDEALRRLSSIAGTGARCGVYTLIFRDVRQPLPHGTHVEDLEHHSVTLMQESLTRPGGSPDRFVWKDPILDQFPLTVDAPPDELRLTKITDIVGRAAKEANRVEVAFDTIAPSATQMWTGDSTSDVAVPIGRLGATRLQYMRLGRGVAQHVLIGGKTGSGKSTLLHALVTNLAMWYSPKQVEFYLVDFKKGVEFKTYATHHLPHARAIAVESDREFGLSVLQRLDAELSRRGDLFRRAGAQDLAGYRSTPGALTVPRTLLIVDEFQEFFSEDDKIGQDASVLLDRLVRQGRAFGIHVLLGSQTIAGASGLGRSTIGQMAVRVALQTSEADSQLILGDNNYAAKLLSRPGEAIYNDQGGLVEGNSPFQIAWLPDEQREVFLERVRKKADASGEQHAGLDAVVFEGNAPADIHANKRLAELLNQPAWTAAPPVPKAYLGEPVAIKDPTAIPFRRQSGSNVLLVGQQEEAAMAMMMTAIVSLAAQHPPGTARFYVLDATPVDSSLAGRFDQLKGVIPHDLRFIEYRAAAEAVNEVWKELQSRREADHQGAATYVFVYGLQRYRALRKAEDDFSFSSSGDAEKPPDPGKQFADLLREGPANGVHVIAWADTPAAVERTLDRGSLREFDHRVLFQMSASDSSNLIDSPAANKLGFHRALAYSEEQGLMEKFRPYAIPDAGWLGEVKERLARRTGGPAT